MQFNIGFESINDKRMFRHGVALSMQPHRSLLEDSISRIFSGRIERFNSYLDNYPESFCDLAMWHFEKNRRSEDYAPGPVPRNLMRPKVFVMMGKLCSPGDIDVEAILDTFDRLLPLYEFVEGKARAPGREPRERDGFQWVSGNNVRALQASIDLPARKTEAVLRHSRLQNALHSHLRDMHGDENVGTELNCGIGKFVDVAVREGIE